MDKQQIERLFKKLKNHTFYLGDIELLRFFIFELDRVKEDLIRVNYEVSYCNNSVDNSKEFWKKTNKY